MKNFIELTERFKGYRRFINILSIDYVSETEREGLKACNVYVNGKCIEVEENYDLVLRLIEDVQKQIHP